MRGGDLVGCLVFFKSAYFCREAYRCKGAPINNTCDSTLSPACVCVCVCVFFPFILDINGRTSRGHTGGRSHRISHPPSFCGACLNFFSREGFSHSFPSSTVKSNFVLLTILSFSTRWAFLFCFLVFLVRKIPFAGIELTSQRVRGLQGTSELPGRS